MASITALIRRHPLPTYFALTFVISWMGLLLVAGPGGVLGVTAIPEALLPLVYMAMLAGPGVAGLLLTGLVDGRAGFRALRTRLLRWRVRARWYVVALLTAPIVWLVVLFALSLASPAYLPGIVASDEKVSLLLIGIATGLAVGCFEELGWTGFAVPRMRLRHSVLATGLLVGLMWGLWHLPLFAGGGDPAAVLPPALVLTVQLFSFLPVFRVLMVWVYNRTQSLLVAILMHTSLVVCILSLAPPAITGVPLVIYDLAVTAALWLVVAAIAVANRGQFTRQPLQRRLA